MLGAVLLGSGQINRSHAVTIPAESYDPVEKPDLDKSTPQLNES